MMDKNELEEYLRGIVLNLPEKPGCYQYLDETGTIIYVGKAKNLKRRVYSYFSKDHQNRKTAILVSKIRDIRYIVVNTEEDALLLENLSSNGIPDTTSCSRMGRPTQASSSPMNTSPESSRHVRLSRGQAPISAHTAMCPRCMHCWN